MKAYRYGLPEADCDALAIELGLFKQWTEVVKQRRAEVLYG